MGFLKSLILFLSILSPAVIAAGGELKIVYGADNTKQVTYSSSISKPAPSPPAQSNSIYRDLFIGLGVLLGIINLGWTVLSKKKENQKSIKDDFWFRTVLFPPLNEKIMQLHQKWKHVDFDKLNKLPGVQTNEVSAPHPDNESPLSLENFLQDLAVVRDMSSFLSVISSTLPKDLEKIIDALELGVNEDASAAFEVFIDRFYKLLFVAHDELMHSKSS